MEANTRQYRNSHASLKAELEGIEVRFTELHRRRGSVRKALDALEALLGDEVPASRPDRPALGTVRPTWRRSRPPSAWSSSWRPTPAANGPSTSSTPVRSSSGGLTSSRASTDS